MAHTLLWFRPLSPLNYALPASLAQLNWASTQHVPIDSLQALEVSFAQRHTMQAAPTWLLSSPTTAHLAVSYGNPSTIAVMGLPTQVAWRAAGGAEPAHWLVSHTGESMGLLERLRQQPRILVVRGQQGRNDLIQALRLAGTQVDVQAVYEKAQHPALASRLNEALNRIHCGEVTDSAATVSEKNTRLALYFSSTDQAARLLALAAQPKRLLDCPVLVSHERIKARAQALGFQVMTHKHSEYWQ